MSSAEADRVRKEYDDADQKLSKLQSRISSLTNKLKEDLGMYFSFRTVSCACVCRSSFSGVHACV